jgi:hypothetical protein
MRNDEGHGSYDGDHTDKECEIPRIIHPRLAGVVEHVVLHHLGDRERLSGLS